MAFKSEIHVAELASIKTGHTEGDIYYILDNGMLDDLPCKPGTFVKWHNGAWQIQPNEHYALASAVDGEIAQAIDNILDDGSASETITVTVPSSQSDDYIVGNYYEVQGKVAKLSSKTDGDNVTELTFDTVSGILEAINSSSGDIKVLYGSSNPGGTTYPDAEDVIDAVTQGKDVVIFWNQQSHLYVYRLVYVFGYGLSGDKEYHFRCLQDRNELKKLSVSDGAGTWSRSTVNSITLPGSIADGYSEASTYSVRDYCTYGGALYRCTTAVTTEEPFDFSKWSSVSVVSQLATIGPDGVFIGSRKIHPGSKLFVEGLPVDGLDYALVEKYNAFIYNRITALATSGTVTLGLWNYDTKTYVSEQQLSTDSDNPTVIDISAANASDTMEIHLKGTGTIDSIIGSIV